MSMKGSVKNVSSMWVHAMKRSVGPGGEVPLDELYEQYGVKHEIEEGEQFISWLREVKLKNSQKWQIVIPKEGEDSVSEDKGETESKSKTASGKVKTLVPKEMDVSDVVNLSVRKGREVLPKITDLNLLKYALQEANQLADKTSLCRIIRKRIKDLQIAR